jgi:RHS repeat-associated protein
MRMGDRLAVWREVVSVRSFFGLVAAAISRMKLVLRRGTGATGHFSKQVVFLLAFAVPRAGVAQIAPTGTHNAGRASDTGHSGATDNGGYATAIPLDLPPARGGLPIPLQIVSGTRGFGAAGLGWDVPLSFVHVDTSYGHRRPAMAPGEAVTPRVRISVSLPGRSVEMIQRGAEWVGRQAPDLTLHANGGDTWTVFDGNGFTYTFTQDAHLFGTGLWLLDSIKGPGGSEVSLSYNLASVSLPNALDPAVSIDLSQVRYNPHPTSGCFKHEVQLVYAIPFDAKPRSFSVIGNRVLMRDHRLIAVDVNSRPSCSASPQRLRRYQLVYDIDPDTQQERLTSLTMSGRQGTPEASSSIPVATYSYGTATSTASGARVLRYQQSQRISLPTTARRLARTDEVVSASVFDPPISASTAKSYASSAMLQDFTGDGRPDLVFQENGELKIARSTPGPFGQTLLGVESSLNDNAFTRPVLDARTAARGRFDRDPITGINSEAVWTQVIDVNGDGRVDIIDAAEKPNYWIIYLNTPGSGTSGIEWVRRAYDVRGLNSALVQRGLNIGFNGYVPLSRRVTGRDFGSWMCWKWNGQEYEHYPAGLDYTDPSQPCFIPEEARDQLLRGPEKTFVEWEVKDVNGDGYPDVVMNSSPVQFVSNGPPPQGSGLQTWTEEVLQVRPRGVPNQLDVMLNVSGLFIADDQSGTATDPFSAPSILLSNTACGVAMWQTNPESDITTEMCGLADINGDAIPDRVDATGAKATALLGHGAGFRTVRIELPGPLSTQNSNHRDSCIVHGDTRQFFHSDLTSGLRDLTGDGFPDFIERQSDATYRVHVGTGAGFAAPIGVVGEFEISRADESCYSSFSDTVGGLFDIDGDGRPERINLVLTAGGWALDVFQLAGGSGPGIPEAGRLVSIDNGYGAVTSIKYRSAKQDLYTMHQVPSAEIVVSSVVTTGTRGLGGTLETTRYAYGKNDLFYDSTLDAFRPTGYLRRVEVKTVPGPGGSLGTVAEITDRYPLDDVHPWTLPFMTPEQRFGRYLKTGQISDVTVLSDGNYPDEWSLLSIDVGTDARLISGVHYFVSSSDAKLFADTISPDDDLCKDIVFPYDFELSEAYSYAGHDPCSARGFLFTNATLSWRGTSAPPSSDNVQTLSAVRSVDDFGRVTSVNLRNDAFRSDDDVCVDTTYATPATMNAPVLTAVASRRVWNCDTTAVYSDEAWEYDHLFASLVSQGLVTSHTIYRHASDTGAYLGMVREFDIDYDAAANPIAVARVRDDGASRITTVDYDQFGLVPLHTAVHGTNVPTLDTFHVFDPVSDELISATDENGTTRGGTYDGFGRPLFETIDTPRGHPGGVLRAHRYIGFESCSPMAAGCPKGRSVVLEEFTDAVALDQVDKREGRTTTLLFDELGRRTSAAVELGGDYLNEKLIVGARTYDPFGRVAFEADPYSATQDRATAYGTTRYFNRDGSLWVEVRGRGPQPLSTVPDAAREHYPTLYQHAFASHAESLTVQGPDALAPNSPQYGLVHEAIASATGQVLSQSSRRGIVPLEHAEYGYDRFGQQTKLTRYGGVAAQAGAVEWSWQFDSVGQMLRLTEPSSAPQERIYSNWGELDAIVWTPSSPEPSHRILWTYDALGRMTHSEEQNAHVTDPATINDYHYDVATRSERVAPTNVIGRLSSANSPSGQVAVSYDGFGRIDARSFLNAEGTEFVEKQGFHGDGSQAWIELQLPDNRYEPERVDYEYDSAGRLRWMWYLDGSNTQELYNASQLDAWGRVRSALFGKRTEYRASHADAGRRLPQSVSVASGKGTRSVAFNSFDPAGRELSRTEQLPTFTGTQSVSYDPLGRLQSSVRTRAGTGTTTAQWAFRYDALGNILELNDQLGIGGAALRPDLADADRICSISFGREAPGPACNVEYDSFGNVTRQPTRSGFDSLSYFNSGAVRGIKNEAGTSTTFRYDPFGALQEVDVNQGNLLVHSDHHFGAFITERSKPGSRVADGRLKSTYIARQFPGPGLVVSRRGAKGGWVFEFGESRGTRFTTDEDGNFLQDLDYAPYGAATSSGVTAAESTYTSDQWNGGDTVGGLGLVHLGARLYDPAIGRFLSRDPLLIARTSATSNPYAFAFNDPINFSDPLGLDGCAENPQCAVSTAAGLGALAATFYRHFGTRFNNLPESGSQSERHAYYSAYAQRLDDLRGAEWVAIQSEVEPANEAFDALGTVAGGFLGSGGALAVDFLRQHYVDAHVATRSWSVGKQLVFLGLNAPVLGNAFNAGSFLREREYGAAAWSAGGAAFDLFTFWLASRVGGNATSITAGDASAGGGSIVRSFRSFKAFKRAMGSAGANAQWHHVVEQTRGNVARFGAEAIHSTENLIRLGTDAHRRVSALYSSIRPDITGSTSLTLRQWLSTQPFEAQAAFGRRVLTNIASGVWP